MGREELGPQEEMEPSGATDSAAAATGPKQAAETAGAEKWPERLASLQEAQKIPVIRRLHRTKFVRSIVHSARLILSISSTIIVEVRK